MTRSSGSISPLLITVGVHRNVPSPRRTERLPSVAATRPVWCSSFAEADNLVPMFLNGLHAVDC